MLEAVRILTEASSSQEATGAILRTLARTTPADALAVLRTGEDGSLTVVAQMGLSFGALTTRFKPADHPRLARATHGAEPVLQNGEIQRVGDDRTRHVDVRVVAATHRDLAREVREGRFREDLLHRLWVYPIAVPPLRDRPEDIPALATHFAGALATRLGIREITLDEELLSEWMRWPWPGNVRQLEHAIERAAIQRLVTQGSPTRAALRLHRPESTDGLTVRPDPPPANSLPLAEAIERARRAAFVDAFRAASGNAAKAALRLGLSRSFAYKEAVRLGILPPAARR